MNRYGWLALVALTISVSPAWAQEPSGVETQARSVTWRYEAVGRLMRNRDPQSTNKNRPPFLLVDKDGKPRCYITPDAGVEISDFVNLRVGVRGSVQAIDGDPLPHIVARRVAPVSDKPIAQQTAQQAPVSQQAPGVFNAAGAQPITNTQSQVIAAAGTTGGAVVQAAQLQPIAEEISAPLPSGQPTMIYSQNGSPQPVMQGEVIQGDPMQGQMQGQMMPGGPPEFGGYGGPMEGCDDCHCGQPDCGGPSRCECRECCLAQDPGNWGVRAEYLLWSTKGMFIPPLATTGPGGDPADPDFNPGILGEPGTQILYGNEDILDSIRSGGRLSLYRYFNPEQTWGIGGEYFGLEDLGETFVAASDDTGNPTISRPYFRIFGYERDANGNLLNPLVPNPAGETFELVSFDDVLAGSVTVDSTTSLNSAGAWLRYNFCCKNVCWPECDLYHDPCNPCDGPSGVPGGVRLGLLAGYRYMRLADGVSITEDLTSLLPAPDQGSFFINDNFQSTNTFNGPEIGVILEARKARWSLEMLMRLAMGNSRQDVQINGFTTVTGANDPNDNGTSEGGLLALPTNIGQYSRDQFAVIPQLGLNLGYNVTHRLRAMVGYTFVYWSQVVRAGEQISLDVNETYIPGFENPPGPTGPERPAFAWRETDFWAQGISLGLDYRF